MAVHQVGFGGLATAGACYCGDQDNLLGKETRNLAKVLHTLFSSQKHPALVMSAVEEEQSNPHSCTAE